MTKLQEAIKRKEKKDILILHAVNKVMVNPNKYFDIIYEAMEVYFDGFTQKELKDFIK